MHRLILISQRIGWDEVSWPIGGGVPRMVPTSALVASGAPCACRPHARQPLHFLSRTRLSAQSPATAPRPAGRCPPARSLRSQSPARLRPSSNGIRSVPACLSSDIKARAVSRQCHCSSHHVGSGWVHANPRRGPQSSPGARARLGTRRSQRLARRAPSQEGSTDAPPCLHSGRMGWLTSGTYY